MTNPSSLLPGHFYHIYNRGNNHENIFIQERNYAYFLRLWNRYINPIADTYAFCLLRNHFHFLVWIKDLDTFPEKYRKTVSKPFSNLFDAYARTINLTYQRSGALFERPFRQIEVNTPTYVKRLIAYIHQNPQKHGFVDDFRTWPYSSYKVILNPDQISPVKPPLTLELFGGRESFLVDHTELQDLEGVEE